MTFDGQCDRYDGTSVASITSAPRFEADQKLAVFFLGVSFLAKVQIICVTGQPGLPDWVSSFWHVRIRQLSGPGRHHLITVAARNVVGGGTWSCFFFFSLAFPGKKKSGVQRAF